MRRSNIVFLSSLFGQFNNDVLFFIPIRLALIVLILIFFFLIPLQRTLIGVTRHWILHNITFNSFMKFVFRDCDYSFRPWILFLYSLRVTLTVIKIAGLFPYGFTLTRHASFTYSIAFPL